MELLIHFKTVKINDNPKFLRDESAEFGTYALGGHPEFFFSVGILIRVLLSLTSRKNGFSWKFQVVE